jgi:hypothetical protein
MDNPKINTTKRWDKHCKAVSKDGRRCHMYEPHEGKHTPKHGTEADKWEDGE